MKNSHTWTVTDFSGGVASNPELPVDGMLASAECVDTSRPGVVTLSRALSAVAGASLDASVAVILSLPDIPDTVNPYVFAFLENGKIWRMRRDGSSPTLVYTDPDGSIVSAAIFAKRLYWATPTRLNNIALEGTSGVSQTTWTLGVNGGSTVQRVFANGNSLHPMVVSEEGGIQALYVADKHVICRLLYDQLLGTYSYKSTYCQFDPKLRIVDMFDTNGRTVVYASDYVGIVGSASKRIVMDMSTVTPLSSKRLDGINVLRAFATPESEYAVVGSSGDFRLYEAVGYDLSFVRKLDSNLLLTSMRRPGNVRADRSSFFFGGAFDGTMHAYGRMYPESPTGYAVPYRLPNVPAGLDACITAVSASGDALVAGGTIYTSPYASHALYLRSGSYVSSGSLTSVPIGLDEPFARKSVERLHVAHELPSGTSLRVYFSADGGAYRLLREMASGASRVTVIDPAEFGGVREFYSGRLRVELLSSSPSATPVLRGLSLSVTSLTA